MVPMSRIGTRMPTRLTSTVFDHHVEGRPPLTPDFPGTELQCTEGVVLTLQEGSDRKSDGKRDKGKYPTIPFLQNMFSLCAQVSITRPRQATPILTFGVQAVHSNRQL